MLGVAASSGEWFASCQGRRRIGKRVRSVSRGLRWDWGCGEEKVEGERWGNDRAHPRWPLMTRYIFQGACQSGRGHLDAIRRASCALGMYSCCEPDAVVTTAFCPACRTSACCCCRAFTAALRIQQIM